MSVVPVADMRSAGVQLALVEALLIDARALAVTLLVLYLVCAGATDAGGLE